jgi:hypothetical protein
LLQVRAEYCRLSWEKPEDDGGTEITSYTVNMLDLDQVGLSVLRSILTSTPTFTAGRVGDGGRAALPLR